MTGSVQVYTSSDQTDLQEERRVRRGLVQVPGRTNTRHAEHNLTLPGDSYQGMLLGWYLNISTAHPTLQGKDQGSLSRQHTAVATYNPATVL